MFLIIRLKKLISALILTIVSAAALIFALCNTPMSRAVKSVCEEMRLSESVESGSMSVNSETAPIENPEENSRLSSEPPARSDNLQLQISESEAPKKDYIKWVDFDVCSEAMDKAFKLDTESYTSDIRINWIEILAYLGTKYGGDFSKYKAKDIDSVSEKLKGGTTMTEIMKDNKYYSYYLDAYTAVLGGFVGEYRVEREGENGEIYWEDRYGLKVFSPIAKGYSFSHYEDFGSSRSYGFKRKHLGHDLMGSVGTPITAVESGTVQALGWNQYGGWRIGIRSFDTKRYYYYAHLRKNHPYRADLRDGDIVKAGDVIGYLGMTGYSTKENVNNITTPHLHYGMQLIFDPSQEDGNNEIWIDLYDITKFIEKNSSAVVKDEEKKEYYRKYNFYEPALDSLLNVGQTSGE